MTADWTWAEAFRIGGTGFGLVFAVLLILALAAWLMGLVLNRNKGDKGEAEENKKGD